MDDYDNLLAQVRSKPETAAPVDDYDSLLTQVRQDRHPQVQSALQLSSFKKPDQEAERANLVRDLKQHLGEDWSPVAVEPEEAKRRLKIAENDHVLQNSPRLAQKYLDTGFADRTFDDVKPLSEIESAIGKIGQAGAYVLGSSGSAMSRLASGFYGYLVEMPADMISTYATKPILGKSDPFGDISSWGAQNRKSLEDRANQIADITGGGKDAGYLARMGYGALESVFQNLVTMPFAVESAAGKTFTAGKGAIASAMEAAQAIDLKSLLPMMISTAGQAYGKASDQGMSPAQAALFATLQGGAEGLTERIGLGSLVRDVKMSAPLWKVLRNQLVTENITEQAATHWQDFNEWAMLPENKDKTFGEYVADRPGAALDTLIQTTIATVLQTSVMRASMRSMRNQMSESQIGQLQEQNLKDIIAAVSSSQTTQRTPQDVIDLIESVDGENATEVHINANIASEVLNQSQLATLVTPEQLEDAAMHGGDIVVPISQFAVAVAQDPSMQAIVEHARTDPDMPSGAETRLWEAANGEAFQKELEAVTAKHEADSEFQQSAKEVEDFVFNQLKSAGRHTESVNRSDALMHKAFASVMAERTGMKPMDFFKQHMLRVIGDKVVGDQFDQSGKLVTDTPEFKKWFGDWDHPKAFSSKFPADKTPPSMAMDWDANKPLVLFHATNADFDIFETGRESITSTTFGPVETRRHAIFTTPDVKFAESYLKKGVGQNVMPVYMDIKSPMDLRNNGAWDYVDELVANGFENHRWPNRSDTEMWEMFDDETGEAFVAAAKKAGYDGAIMYEVNDDDKMVEVYVAFDPTQIKSATGNNGQFNPNDPNILHQQSVDDFLAMFDEAATIELTDAKMSEEQIDEAERQFLSAFPEGTRYGRDTRLLKRVRRESDTALDEIRGDSEVSREVASRLGPFSSFKSVAEILPADSFNPNGSLRIAIFGKEQVDSGLIDEPALTITVTANGELTINGPEPGTDTFAEFKARGWADYARGANGEVQQGWTALTNPENPGQPLPIKQLLPLLADTHARVREWRGEDYVGLHWTRATGALGGLFSQDESAVFFQSENRQSQWYYSNLSRQIEAAPDKVFGPAKQVKAWLQSNAGKLGIKADEIQWTGINDWLDLQQRVTKADVLAYLDANGVQVEEVVKGAPTEEFVAANRAYRQSIKDDAPESVQDELKAKADALRYGQEKYAQYVLPGGENYRELLLTLPATEDSRRAKLDDINAKYNAIIDAHGVTVQELPPAAKAEIDRLTKEHDKIADQRGGDFHSAHWDEPNILAHIRFNDRTDAEGNKVLFIEELQSDWGQKGKKEGFDNAKLPSKPTSYADIVVGDRISGWGRVQAIRDGANGKEFDVGGLWITEAKFNIVQVENRDSAIYNDGVNQKGVPSAPFVTDTKAWVALAVKRMIAHAAQNGYDKVAFVTGEQSAERYDLSKQVGQIEYYKNKDGKYQILATAIGDNRTSLLNNAYAENELEDVVGKGVAEKIINGQGSDAYISRPGHPDGNKLETKILRGLDLKVGGEGMKSFYDKIVPQVVNDVLKKVGGGKVESVNISNSDNRYTVEQRRDGVWAIRQDGVAYGPPAESEDAAKKVADRLNGNMEQLGFTITQAMREKVAGGQALFQNNGGNRGSFNPDTNTIALLQNADLSTFLHESGHYFLEVIADVASQPNAPAQIKQDMDVLLGWFGVQATQELSASEVWSMMTLEEKRQYHEQFARGFESYLFEGKAPSLELQGIFSRFRRWLLDIYKSISSLDVQLTDEVRGVMDRMLATDEQIADAEAARRFAPIFQTQEESGMDDAQWAAYQAEPVDATDAAAADLQARSIRDMRWLSNAKSKKMAELQKASKALRDVVTMDVRREVMSQPIYMVWNFLSGKPEKAKAKPKKSADLDPTTDSLFVAIAKLGGLDRLEIVQTWGTDQEDIKKLPRLVFGKPIVRTNDGKSIDELAQRLSDYGYLATDEHGKVDVRDLEDLFAAELRGDEQYSNQKDYAAAMQEREPGIFDLENFPHGKLDSASVQQFYGSDSSVPTILEGLKMLGQDGYLPDEVAAEFGFSSGDDMMRQLAVAQSPNELIAQMVDQRMLSDHAELSSEQAIEAAAEAAIHNDVRAKFLTRELNALRKAVGKSNVLLKAARDFAAQKIASLKVRDAVKSNQHTAAEARSAREADKAFKAGKLEEAATHKRDQVLNHELARASLSAKAEIAQIERWLKRFDNATTRKAISHEYRDQIDALLEKFDLRQSVSDKELERRRSLSDWIASQEAMGLDPAIDDRLTRDLGKKHIRDLTLDELRGLKDSIANIEHLGRLKNQLLTAAKNRNLAAASAEIAASLNKYGKGRGLKDADIGDAHGLAALKQFGEGFAAEHRKLASIARQMDGDKDGGPMWEYFIRSMNAAGDKEATMRAEMSEKLANLFDQIKGVKLNRKEQVMPGVSMTRENILMMALNWGNAGNRQRLMDGGLNNTVKTLTEYQVNSIIGRLSKEEMDFVQGVWDLLEANRPAIAAQELRLTGVEPKWVEPTPVVTDHGTYRGGYFPAKYDGNFSSRSNELEAITDLRQQMQGAAGRAQTRRGYTQERAAEVVKRPLKLGFSVLTQHINEVTHRLAWQDWLIDTNRLLKRDEIEQAIRDHYGPVMLKQIKDTVKDIAAGDIGASSMMERGLNHMRTGATIAGLGWNLTTSFLQPLGLTQSIVRIGWGPVARGAKAFIAHPWKTIEEVESKSAFMKNRAATMNREINDVLNNVRNTHISRVESSFFYTIQMMQKVADMPTWLGEYEKQIAAGNDDARAIALADQAVIDAQGAGQMKDLSAIQRGVGPWGAAKKLFTNFYSYFNVTYNLAVERGRATDFKSPAAVSKLAADYLMLFTVPAILGALLKELVRGSDDDWDKEKLMKKLAKEQLNYLMGTMVLTREIGAAVTGDYGYSGPAGVRLFAEMNKLSTQVQQGEIDKSLVKAAVNVAGIAGLPVVGQFPAGQINRTIDGIVAVSEGTAGPQAVIFGAPLKH